MRMSKKTIALLAVGTVCLFESAAAAPPQLVSAAQRRIRDVDTEPTTTEYFFRMRRMFAFDV
jgi:hypothetical protein